MLIKYFIIVLLMWLSFIVVIAVTVSILVIVIIVVIITSRVLQRVKTRKGKFDILIIMTTSLNVTYIGRYNGMLPQDNKNTSEWNLEL